MTNFKVTKEDIGRIAIDENWCEWKLVHWEDGSKFPATWRFGDVSYTSSEYGTRTDDTTIIKWKSEKREPLILWISIADDGLPLFAAGREFEGAIKFIEVLEDGEEAPKTSGRIEWHGGECPVPAGEKVRVWLEYGRDDITCEPEEWRWEHMGYGGDIIAYEILEEGNE